MKIVENDYDIPADWNDDSVVLDGLDVVDKNELAGIPFRIIGVSFTTNDKGFRTAFIDGERADRTTFTFTDSSTGIKEQILAHLIGIGMDSQIDNDDVYIELPKRLIVPNGVRVSKYEIAETNPVTGRATGRMREARTYYLTTSGKRPGAPEKSTPAAKRASRTAS